MIMPDTKYVSNFMLADEQQVWVKDVEARQMATTNAGDIDDLELAVDGLGDRVQALENADTGIEQEVASLKNIMKRRIKKVGTYIVAHAGNAGDAPQNSKVGILRACHYGYDAIEFDTQISLDNVPVVAHNDSLSSFSTGTGTISGQNYSVFQDAVITANPYPSRYSDTEKTIPTVEDALNIIRRCNDITPVIDIKDSYNTLAEMNALLNVCDKCGVRYQTIFLCDSETKAELLLQADSNLSIMLIADSITTSNIAYCVQKGIIGIDCNVGGLTRASADSARSAGLIVGAWTINESNISSMSTYRGYIPDMWTVWSPAYFANGASYGQGNSDFGNFWNTYKTTGLLTAINKFDWDRICSGAFTWHASTGDDPYPVNSNYAILNRAMLCKRIPASQGDTIVLKGSPTFQYNVVEYSKTAKLTSSGWVQTDYTVANASTVFVIIEARRSDDAALSIIDLDTFTNGVFVP